MERRSKALAIKKEIETLNNEYADVLKYLKSMCDTYQSFEELEEKDDPRTLLDNLESKSKTIESNSKTLESIKEYVYKDLQTNFNELKSMIASPKLFLIQHFDGVRNQIDLECQKCLDNNELMLKYKEKAILEQQEMIDGVDSFQKKCLANLKKEQTHQINLEEFEKRLKLQDKDDVMELGKDLCCATYNFKRELFMNQGIVFFSKVKYKKLFEKKGQYYSEQDYLINSLMFGSLILIEDEFLINSDTFESWSENEYKDKQIEVDYCNEFLASNILKRRILNQTNNFNMAVNRVKLERIQLNELDSRFFNCDKTLVEKWSSDLPCLTKLSWNRLDKRVFQHLVNLEELNFSYMYFAKVDSNTFACNKKLRKLKIRSEKLSLNNRSFYELVNLTELDLSSNNLAALPDGLFDSCIALKVVDLSDNKFLKLETSTFQNLVNLEELDLSSNSIKELDSNLFLCNKKLIKLRLNTNKITKLNENFFRGLIQLTHLNLAKNQLTSLPEGPFDNCLKVVNLSRNKLIKLETSTFQTWVKLEDLDLSYNSIERADYSNIFAFNKNLRKLNISGISSKSLNNQSFYGLNLTVLHLQYCQIMDLTEKLFNSLDNLTGLDLCGNKIISLPDGIFKNLTYLKVLDLSFNQISDLPNELFHSLVNLESLHLYQNKLTNIPDDIFKNLTNLKDLTLSSNQISELPNELFHSLVNLESFYLHQNKLTNIPKGLFDNLISLSKLYLGGNKIEFQVDSDPNIFKGLRKLTSLYLSNNQISILPEGIFKNLVSLEELGLDRNHIMSLPKEFFKDLFSLKSLRLEGNEIETEDGNSFYIQMKNVKPIPEHIEIDLSDYDDSNDEDSTDEEIKGQNDPEADEEQDTKKRDLENAEETLDLHNNESNPKRFKK